MSKAFTSEETRDAPELVRPRAPLPAGVPNYVTARGLAQLRAELVGLASRPASAEQAAALAERRAALEERIASAELVAPPPSDARAAVRFGAAVTVSGALGERRYRIVGVDEADPASGRIAFTSPLARALIGRALGDEVRVRAPRGAETLEIVAVDYEP
ncbi:MAG TPA: GreA/GreB family elongation factor [Myxococcota bacterium]|nr:GreA/GreB family elongation factor [Myxococcota bacterium]